MALIIDGMTSEGLADTKSLRTQAIVQATAASTLTLDVTSEAAVILTGTTAGQLVKLGVATTYQVGHLYEVHNNSTQTVTVQNNTPATLFILAPGQRGSIILQDNSTAAGVWVFVIGGASSPGFGPFIYMPDQLDSPNNASWVVNALAPASVDSINGALVIRTFDDTTNQGVGFTLPVPSTARNLTIRFKWRCQTAAIARVLVVGIYARQIANNSAIGAWSAKINFTNIATPTTTNYQFSSQTFALTTLGVTAGNLAQFEFIRDGANASDTLVGNMNLVDLEAEFY